MFVVTMPPSRLKVPSRLLSALDEPPPKRIPPVLVAFVNWIVPLEMEIEPVPVTPPVLRMMRLLAAFAIRRSPPVMRTAPPVLPTTRLVP